MREGWRWFTTPCENAEAPRKEAERPGGGKSGKSERLRDPKDDQQIQWDPCKAKCKLNHQSINCVSSRVQRLRQRPNEKRAPYPSERKREVRKRRQAPPRSLAALGSRGWHHHAFVIATECAVTVTHFIHPSISLGMTPGSSTKRAAGRSRPPTTTMCAHRAGQGTMD